MLSYFFLYFKYRLIAEFRRHVARTLVSDVHSFCTSSFPVLVLLVASLGLQWLCPWAEDRPWCRMPASFLAAKWWLLMMAVAPVCCLLSVFAVEIHLHRPFPWSRCWAEVHRRIKQTHHGPNWYPALDLLGSVLVQIPITLQRCVWGIVLP